MLCSALFFCFELYIELPAELLHPFFRELSRDREGIGKGIVPLQEDTVVLVDVEVVANLRARALLRQLREIHKHGRLCRDMED